MPAVRRIVPLLDCLSGKCFFGANNANLPKVIQIMADALMMDAMPMGHEVKTRVINLCKQVQVIRVQ